MKKALVVTNDRNVGAALWRLLKVLGFEVVTSNHEEALATFLTEDPSHVLILEYSEIGEKLEEHNIGRRTYDDIKKSASPGTRIIRCGLENYHYDDYLRLPFEIGELKRLLL